MPKSMLQRGWKAMEPELVSSKFHQVFGRGIPIFIQIIKNFIYLSQTEYEIFPYQLEIDA